MICLTIFLAILSDICKGTNLNHVYRCNYYDNVMYLIKEPIEQVLLILPIEFSGIARLC